MRSMKTIKVKELSHTSQKNLEPKWFVLVRCAHLQQLSTYVDKHGNAGTQQAVCAAARVREQCVPQPHSVRKGELLHVNHLV